MTGPNLRSLAPKAFLSALLFLLASVVCTAQTPEIDYNTYYRFPLSVGIEYQALSPFGTYGSQYNIFDISAALRWPLRTMPALQPTARAGMTRFTHQDSEATRDWTHTHFYGSAGLTYSHRFAKNFEIGGEALAGFSEAIFREVLPEEGTVSSANLLFEGGARIALNPSFNLSIDVHPNVKYLLSLSDLEEFNGFIFGIGFCASYRFGQDPDAPGAVIRSLRFEQVSMPAVFAAMQSYYVNNPVGRVTLVNTEKHAITDVEVDFLQPGYMDSPTPAAAVERLEPGQSAEVPLFASFNREVFATEGVTPLTGEVIARYKSRGKPAEQRQSVTYDLHDKTAMTWDDDRKVAAFITPADSALRNYSSFIRQACKEQQIPLYNGALQLAIQVFHALAEIGCLYQADPTLPFTRVQENPVVVDSVSLPRDTLRRITGDCDDLTVLYCSLLEAAGAETAFITVPGHIYSAFNTGEAGREYQQLHPERSMTINVEGELWVPVEITLIGKSGFVEAWRKGAEQWLEYGNAPEKRGFYRTRECQEVYRPVGLRETDLGLQYGRTEAIIEGFERDMDRVIEAVATEHSQAAHQSGREQDYNKLGIVYARFQRYAQAERAFQKALDVNPAYLSAQVNLANLLYLKKDFSRAVEQYLRSYDALVQRGMGQDSMALKVLLNISKAYYLMEDYGRAEGYYARAERIDAQKAAEHAYLGTRRSSQARAAEERDPEYDILFVEE
ncbi:MAG: hypothetical protein JXB06_02690 [Spirochaetales bacterium]|nr:hypothetical protein [Spirochaetales bacterium]